MSRSSKKHSFYKFPGDSVSNLINMITVPVCTFESHWPTRGDQSKWLLFIMVLQKPHIFVRSYSIWITISNIWALWNLFSLVLVLAWFPHLAHQYDTVINVQGTRTFLSPSLPHPSLGGTLSNCASGSGTFLTVISQSCQTVQYKDLSIWHCLDSGVGNRVYLGGAE